MREVWLRCRVNAFELESDAGRADRMHFVAAYTALSACEAAFSC